MILKPTNFTPPSDSDPEPVEIETHPPLPFHQRAIRREHTTTSRFSRRPPSEPRSPYPVPLSIHKLAVLSSGLLDSSPLFSRQTASAVRPFGVGFWRMSQALEPSELTSVLFYVGKGEYVNTLAIRDLG